MTLRNALISLAFLAAPAWAQDMPAAPADPATLAPLPGEELDLNEFLWTARPIVIFADSPLDPRFSEQLELLAQEPEALLQRDVVVLTDTAPAARSALRQKLRPRGFILVLIDKDGGVKLRKPAPWSVREITHSIDKWPTRQREIREELGKD